MLIESLTGWRGAAVLLGLSLALGGCAHVKKPSARGGAHAAGAARGHQARRGLVAHRHPLRGPQGRPGREGSVCAQRVGGLRRTKQKDLSGNSAKFECETSRGHQVKVKYGPRNAEVFGEVLATRLFWTLGFAADSMYPVRVRCRGCPKDPKHGPEMAGEVVEFDPAAIERKLPGRAMETRKDSGWRWSELEEIGPQAPPGARAERDALKLLAAFVQHTDNKAANQRLLCPKGEEVGRTGCRSPVLMVNDLGLTFGHAGLMNKNVGQREPRHLGAVAGMEGPRPVRRGVSRARSRAASSDPKIGDAGRAFLAGLLVQLTDAQLRDLFETARVKRRSSDPSSDPSKDAPPAPRERVGDGIQTEAGADRRPALPAVARKCSEEAVRNATNITTGLMLGFVALSAIARAQDAAEVPRTAGTEAVAADDREAGADSKSPSTVNGRPQRPGFGCGRSAHS